MREKGLRKVLRQLAIDVDREENGWLICKCPFAHWRHKKKTDSTPSFGVSISTERSGFNCWSCHSHGTLPNLAFQLARLREEPELVQVGHKIERDELLEAEDDIDFGEWGNAGSTAKKKDRTKITFPNEGEYFRKYRSAFDFPEACDYLRRRDIHSLTIAELDLRYDPRQQRVLFPVHDYWTGRFAGFSGRVIWSERERKLIEKRRQRELGNPKYKIPKVRDYGGLNKIALVLGARGHIHGFANDLQSGARRVSRDDARSRLSNTVDSHAAKRDNLICVEGLLAYARFTQLGFSNVTALLGAKVTPEKAEILRDINRPIYWLTDPDIAGRSCLYGHWNAEEETFEGGGALETMYGDVAQFVLEYPEGVDDVDYLTYDQICYMLETADLWMKGIDKRNRKV